MSSLGSDTAEAALATAADGVDTRTDLTAPNTPAPKHRPSHPDSIPRGSMTTPADLAAKEEDRLLAKNRATLEQRAAGNELGFCGGGSSDAWNDEFLLSLSLSLPSSAGSQIAQDVEARAMLKALEDSRPSDPIEAMLLGQILAANATSLELRRRAWLDRLPERQAQLLSLADKMARSMGALVDALNRHRSRGRQTVRVEHVTVQAGA